MLGTGAPWVITQLAANGANPQVFCRENTWSSSRRLNAKTGNAQDGYPRHVPVKKRLHCSSTNATQNYYIKEKEMFLQNEGMLRTMPTCLAAGGPPETKPESWDTPPLLLQTALREKLPEASAPRNTRNPVWSLYLQHFISKPDDSETMIRQCLVQELSEQKQTSWSGHHPNHPSQTLKAEPNPNLNLEVNLLDLQKVQALY